jgi:dihydroflavonol-4-reductase
MMTQKNRILVTGASGFLGSRLVKQLVARGESVKAFVRAGSRLEMFAGLPPEAFELAYGDVLVRDSVYRALASCSRLIHVAGNFSMWAQDPASIMEPAVLGTKNVLWAAERRGIERIVITSSVGVLGVTDGPTTLTESHGFNVEDPETYYLSKLRADEIVREAQSTGLPIVSVLPAALFGPGDWKPTPNGRLLLDYLRRSPDFRVPIFEGGFNLVDVDDVAMGHVLALERGRPGERYILGGDNVTYEQLFSTLSDLTGLAAPGGRVGRATLELLAVFVKLWARWTGEPPPITRKLIKHRVNKYSWVSSEKAEHDLGYRHRPHRETLDRAIRWYLRNRYLTEQQARRIWLELRTA